MTDTTEETMIGGVKASAPMFRKVPEQELLAIVDLISDASYHFASDDTREWFQGNAKMREVGAKINEHRLAYAAIERLYLHKPQLVQLETVFNAVLANARGQQ